MQKLFLKRIKIFFKILLNKLSLIEKIVIGLLSFVIILNIFGVFDRFFDSNQGVVPEKGGILVEGVVGQPKFINPLFARSDVDKTLSSLVFAGLVSYNKQHEIVPNLAERWEVSEDKRVYKFFLKQDIKWHDGIAFDAEDVVYTIAVMQNPDYTETLKASWDGIAVEKNDRYTLTFSLPKSYPSFLENLTIGIIPRHIWDPIPVADFAKSTYNINAIGAGNYKISSVNKNKEGGVSSIKMASNEFRGSVAPNIENLEVRFYDTKDDLFKGFKMREFSSFGMYSSEGQEIAGRTRGFNNYKVNLPQYVALFFNKKQNAVLGDLVIRQALSYSLDKEKINNIGTYGAGTVIYSPILPGYLGYDSGVKKYDYDQKAATSLLAQSGWSDQNNDGVKEKDEKKLEFNLITINDERLIKVAEEISQEWGKIGVKINIKKVDGASLDKDYLQTRNYDILLFGESVGNDPDPYPYWHSSQAEYPGLNIAGFANGEVDKLLEEARQSNDTNIKIKNYKKFQEIITEDAPAIFLYQPVYIYKIYDKVKGIDLAGITNTWERFSGIKDWYVKYRKN